MKLRIAAMLADLLFLLIGSVQVWMSLRLPNGGIGLSAAEPGPGLFPMITGSMMCLAAFVHLVQCARINPDDGGTDTGVSAPVWLLALSIGVYVLLLPRAGFLVSAFLLLLCTLSIYGMPGVWRRAGTALLATILANLVFTKGLSVTMPVPAWFA